jgi:hypothetical protein
VLGASEEAWIDPSDVPSGAVVFWQAVKGDTVNSKARKTRTDFCISFKQITPFWGDFFYFITKKA